MMDIQFPKDNADLKDKDKEFDVIILGAGPAGLTSAIYTSRSLLKTLIIETGVIGGEAASTELIENYPGFPEGVSGMDLTDGMKMQSEKFGAKIIMTYTKEVNLKGNRKVVKTDDGVFSAKAIIIATGSSPRNLNIPGEEVFKGRGVSYCATCDAPFFKDRDIGVIGAGSSGIQESLYLLKFTKSIKIVEFLPHMTAEKILQERIKKYETVEFFLNHTLKSINGKQMVESITVEDRKVGTDSVLPVSGVFIYVGLRPNTKIFMGSLKLNENGFIIADENLRTSESGVFAAGDVREKTLRQVATAVGDGAVAAFSAKEYIEGKSSTD